MHAFAGTPRFALVRRLGAGGMGVVYEAFDRDRRTRVALKTLSVNEPDALLRFKREFRALQGIPHHRNLVSLGELFEHDGTWFFSMEYLTGVDLLTHVRGSRQGGHFDVARLRAAFHQLAIGLTTLHRHGHVHRDVKPENVMVTPENRVVLLDFGLVREVHGVAHDTKTNLVFGTAEYMAPEQAYGHPAGPRADWYAAGAMLYEALTGQPPFVGAPLQVLLHKQTRDPRPPRALAEGIPGDLDELCMLLLRREPRERPDEAEIFRRLHVERRDDVTSLLVPMFPRVAGFVGRAHELSCLEAAYERAAAGEAAAVLLDGEWGLGKTALVRELARRLNGRALPPAVIAGRCDERETIPYNAFDSLADELSRVLGKLPEALRRSIASPEAAPLAQAFPVLRRLDVFAELLPSAATEDHETRLAAALRGVLERLALSAPVVLVLEDLQWADDASMRLVEALLARPGTPALLLVATTQPPGAARVAPLLAAAGRFQALTLEPLAAGEIAELVASYLGSAASDAAIARIAAESRGHPVLALELCFSKQGRAGRTLDHILSARMSKLSEEARLVLGVVAVAGAPLIQETAARASELPNDSFMKQIEILRTARLVRTIGARRSDRMEVFHQRVREAVLAHLLPAVARDLHRRLAVALTTVPATAPETLAWHWERAGEGDTATALLLDGGAQAEAAADLERAVRLYRRALQAAKPADQPAIAARLARLPGS